MLQQAPNYYKVIGTPMDLSKIKKKMSGSVGMASRYENACEMISDIVLMLNNCIEFNGVSLFVANLVLLFVFGRV